MMRGALLRLVSYLGAPLEEDALSCLDAPRAACTPWELEWALLLRDEPLRNELPAGRVMDRVGLGAP